jgi:glycosyltransferase involved in cell wall biosynthesis
MKFSVITVCLNAAGHLTEAMESVLGQNYPDLEYLVLDGGSTDGSVDLIREMAGRDRRISWWSKPDRGISDAMNCGLALANGDVIAFLHADDSYSDSGVLTRVADIFSGHSEVLWATGGIQEVDVQGSPLRVVRVRRFSQRRLLRNNIILHPATFVRREAFGLAGGFDPSLNYTMDYDLWLRLAKFCPPVAVDQILANFRVHAGSISSANRQAVLREEFQVRQRHLISPVSRTCHAIYHKWRYWHVS